MCGIAGLIRWDDPAPTSHEVHAMCDAMIHRGPDDEGLFVGDGAAIGMRRLSIIDLATGHQPVHNEDESLWVVFNGEIYNYQELRAELESRGHRFYTTSDTETIVHLYEDFGAAAVDKLRGMFAFAIWDRRRRELFIARDRVGIKPLFYAEIPGGLAFASELKALLALPAISRQLDWPAVAHLFTFLSTPATHSILRGVKKLDAGHRLIAKGPGTPAIDRYWDVEFNPRPRTEGECVEELRALLEEAVTLHMRSDVPVGAFLSGGLDSSAIVSLMSRMTPRRVKTFSIGFHEAAFDELRYARQIAHAFGTDHHELVLAPQALDIVEDLTWALDEPFGDSSAIPTYMVSQLAAEHVKVVLSGDGGDELFGGYDKYVVEARERRYERVPSVVRRAVAAIGRALPDGTPGKRFMKHFALDGAARYLDATSLFAPGDHAQLFAPAVFDAVRDADPYRDAREALGHVPGLTLSSLQYCDLRAYLPLDILTKVDRMTMAHSLEARPALLDHRLVEFAASLPADLKIRNGETKYVFKQAMRGRLPDSTIDRKKQGFGVPLASWFRGPWTSFARDLLLSRVSRERGVIDPSFVAHLLKLHDAGRPLDREIWTLVSFEQWCRMFLDGPPRPAARPQPAVLHELRTVNA